MRKSLFIYELDGLTFADRDELDEYRTYQAEARAEGAWLRAAECNPSVLEEEYLNPFLNDPAVGLVARGF